MVIMMMIKFFFTVGPLRTNAFILRVYNETSHVQIGRTKGPNRTPVASAISEQLRYNSNASHRIELN